MKKVRIILSSEAEVAYAQLVESAKSSKVSQTILRSIENKFELIKLNSHYGEPISHQKIPFAWKEKYGVRNLFWVQLADHWRMLYYLTHNEQQIEVIAFVLDILSHSDYD